MNKSIITVTFLLFIFSCNTITKKEKNVEKPLLSAQRVKESNLIVSAIVVQDSLKVLKSDDNSKFLCDELRKLFIDIPEEQANGLTPPPAPGRIYLIELLNTMVNEEVFFTSKDSSNLLAQNTAPSKLKIDQSVLKNINFLSIEKEIKKGDKDEMFRFYEMTLPIFSMDNKKAYVELSYSCGSLCGYGKAIYLKKIKGKWIIVRKVQTWIS